jgi:hypothetical protein
MFVTETLRTRRGRQFTRPFEEIPLKLRRKTKGRRVAMIFYNHEKKPVEVNSCNFRSILRGQNFGLTPIELKDRTIQWIKATEDEILKAAND